MGFREGGAKARSRIPSFHCHSHGPLFSRTGTNPWAGSSRVQLIENLSEQGFIFAVIPVGLVRVERVGGWSVTEWKVTNGGRE